MAENAEIVVELRDVVTRFDEKLVHDGISLQVRRGEVLAVVGGSGSGKSTLLREMVMLLQPTAGSVTVLGRDVTAASEIELLPLRRRLGVMFQDGALFGGQTVLENTGVPLREHTELSGDLIDEIAQLKLLLTGLEPSVGALWPNQLSGGMRKRAALARALALDPELLFLDEPSSGLDPISADGLDDLILQLKELLGLTIVMVTHDMDSLWRVADRVVLLGDKRILGAGTMTELSRSVTPGIGKFFSGPRARVAAREHNQGASL
ncbi:MAG: ATP-binding cassette domain-containing protein [Gammaproteobacteria bacterium]|nr:ATP-binding cassette domain-containing protein [Gammaproteobacteria bacterium]MDH3768811.1 ATP-binding cassette domain-containing protein [Gammaproteobacteria bacterium]